MTIYLPYDPQQQFLLPHALQDWLPEGHLAYFVSDTVDLLDLSAFHVRYAGGGPRNQPFHPAMMVKVKLYAYASGVFSSRKIARKLHEDVAFRILGAGNFPKHRTICDFRALHLDELAALFVQVVKLARECGLVKLGTIAVDGTKVKASASRHKAMSHQRMVETEALLEAQIADLLNKAGQADMAEKNDVELDIPAEIERREDRLKVIQAARERLESRQREADLARGRSEGDDRIPRDKDGKPKNKNGNRYARDFGVPEGSAQDNFTDPDSRIMKRAGGGFDQCYNGQTAVDAHAQIIIAAELTNCGADSGELPCMLAAVDANLGASAEVVLADAGYRAEAVFRHLAAHPTELMIALGREGRGTAKIDAKNNPYTVAMVGKMATAEAQAAYRRRKAIVEPPNAWIKHIIGFRQFSMRGLNKARAEWKLVCAALNLRRMSKLCMW